MSSLLSVAEAQLIMLSAFSPLEEEQVDLAHAAGRVLAKRVYSRFDLPPFDNSSMDGFAVRYVDVIKADLSNPIKLMVIGDIPAGRVFDQHLGVMQAIRIMTGALVPEGADAVIPVEDTDFQDKQPGTPAPARVKVYKSAKPGQYIRSKGQDVKIGGLALELGGRLRPQDVGFLAMLGIANVPVYCLPRIAVFSSGDELLPLDAQMIPGKIYESNSFMLSSMIHKYHGEVIYLGIIPDRLDAVRNCFQQAVQKKVDLILSSAGVSVGALDFVRSVVEQDGHLEFWRVNMRPGKPIAFGKYQGIPFIGLPGNPVSAFVGFEMFVRPIILKMGGVTSWNKPYHVVKVNEYIESDGRESFLRAYVRQENGEWVANLTSHQGSGNLKSLVQANALLLVPSGVKSLPIDSEMIALLLDQD